jgi:parallel beta-helix repeat protein
MKKRIGIILVCMILFSSFSIVVSPLETVKSNGNKLFVGGSGAGNYTSIQGAIDDAENGDDVFVYNGIYIENLIVNKSIDLIGENREITVIDGNSSNDVIIIINDNVLITNFSIKNSGNNAFSIDSGIKIRYSFDVSIINCKIYDSNSGITIQESENSYINNCDISNNNLGIVLLNSSYNYVASNYISNSSGSYLLNLPGSGTHIAGIVFAQSSKNTLKNNIFSNNLVGIVFYNVFDENDRKEHFDNSIDTSNIINGKPVYYFFNQQGILLNNLVASHITLAFCEDFIIKNCLISKGDGLFIFSSSNNSVINCNSSYNYIGLNIRGSTIFPSSNNNIQSCEFLYNSDGFGVAKGSGNIISDCTIQNNSFGASLDDSPNNFIRNNNFYDDGLTIGGDNLFDFIQNIENNQVNGKPLYYFQGKENILIDGDPVGQIILIDCSNVSVMNTDISNTHIGIEIQFSNNILIDNCIVNYNSFMGIGTGYNSHNIRIVNCSISNNLLGISFGSTNNSEISRCNLNNNKIWGITLDISKNNLIHHCNIDNVSGFGNWIGYGICIARYSDNNEIWSCNITNNSQFGILLGFSYNNKIYHNNFIGNLQNAFDDGNNIWYDEKKGNYWDDYEERYPDAKKLWLKGIWDTPYDIPNGDNQDKYPLIKPDGKSKNKTFTFIDFYKLLIYRFPFMGKILNQKISIN